VRNRDGYLDSLGETPSAARPLDEHDA
jgi:hypothetical protein